VTLADRMRPIAFVLACLFVAGGCRRATVQSEPDPTPKASASAPLPVDGLKAARSLALSPVSGSTPIDALLTAREATAQKADAAPEWIALGHLWVRKARESGDPGHLLNANASIDLALARAEGDRAALDLRAIVLHAEGRYEDARVLARKLADRDEKDARAFGTLGDILIDLGRIEQATGAIDHMVDLKPDRDSWSRQARLRWLQGKPDEAFALAKKAVDAGRTEADLEPVARVAVLAGDIRWSQGKLAAADASFDDALALQPDFPPALVGKARIALAREDGKRATELLERAWKASPLAETAWLLGDARTTTGDTSGAKKAYEDVVRAGQKSDKRTLSLFWTTREEEPLEALKLADAERNVRGDPTTIDAYAWALHRNRRFAEARLQMDAALRTGIKDARSIFHDGAIAIALGDVEVGKKRIRQALALNPKFDLTSVAEAQRLLSK
jgi:tetratricopeptide (TPR) repeat protein